MSAEIFILGTGNELASGRSVDTNSPWMAVQLSELGLKPRALRILPDDPEALESEVLSLSADKEKRVILMTGGLGPTADDFTLEVACKIGQCQPKQNEEAANKLKRIFAARGRDYSAMKEFVERQTSYPEKAEVIPNPVGIAPGFRLAISESTYWICLPGVPTEMKEMFTSSVLPWIETYLGRKELHSAFRTVWGHPESAVEKDFLSNSSILASGEVRWGIAAKPGFVKLSFESEDRKKLEEVLDDLHAHYQHECTLDIWEEIPRILKEHNKSLSVAESCTGGLIAKLFTDAPGSSEFFYGSVVAYDNSVKENILGVPSGTLESQGAVSPDTAIQMAEGVRRALQTDFAISVTGIAGPGGSSPGKKVGLLYIGVSSEKKGTESFRYFWPTNRQVYRDFAANTAVFRLYERIREELS